MTFLSPIAGLIAAGIVVPLLVALYFLKLRRRQMVVSSTLLWKRAIQDLQVNAPFQRLRRNLLLLLQLLILAGLLLAFARPTFKAAARAGERLVIVIDQSASMNATDVPPSRLSRAKELALQLVDGFDGAGGAMVVSFAQQARVVQPFTTDKKLLRSKIQAIEATDCLSRLEPALQLIEPYAVGQGSAAAAAGGSASGGAGGKGGLSVYVFSDGRFQEATKLALRGGALKFVSLGSDAAKGKIDNLGIVALSARRDPARPARVQVFARLANYGQAPVKANVTLSVEGQVGNVTSVEIPAAAPDKVAADGTVTFGAAGSREMPFELSASGAVLVTVTHDHDDQLAADNSASLYLAPPQLLRVLLVTPGNAFLEQAVRSAGVRKLVLMTPKRFEDQDPEQLRRRAGSSGAGSDEGFDLIVFDRHSPTTTPLVDSLYFAGLPPVPGLSLRPTAGADPQTQVFLSWEREHPLLRYVTLDDVLLVEPGRLVLPAPGTATILATAQSGPVLAEVQVQGVRQVIASFDLLKTNWPMQVSFAVFMSNCVAELGGALGSGGAAAGGGPALSYRSGDVASIPAGAGLKQVAYTGPMTLVAPVERGRAVLPAFERVGLYESQSGVEAPWDRLAVNLTDPVESDLRPAARLEVGALAVPAAPGSGVAGLTIRQEVWAWFLWAALAVLLLEWLIYTRRMHL